MNKIRDDGEYIVGEADGACDVYLTDFFDAKRLYALADDAYEKLQKNLAEIDEDKAEVEGGEHECILSPSFTSMLAHEAVGHTCEADSVAAKNSVAAANMGKQVASELVSLTDFAHTVFGEHCTIPLHIDDEGTPCIDAPIIKNGVLVGCMTNRILAERLGFPATGNARASEYYDEPIIRMRNTCFHGRSVQHDGCRRLRNRARQARQTDSRDDGLRPRVGCTEDRGYGQFELHRTQGDRRMR